MHTLLTFLAQTATTPTTGAKPAKSSSSFVPLLVIFGLFAVFYFFVIRPRQQRTRQQQTKTKQMAVGDQVMSAGGIYGTVVALDDNLVEVEVAPGVVLNFIRRSVSVRTDLPVGPGEEADEDKWNVPPGFGSSSAEAGDESERHGDFDPPDPDPI